jgi:hypothetical protein
MAWLRHHHPNSVVRWLNGATEQHEDHDIEIQTENEKEARHIEVKTRWRGCDPRMNQISERQLRRLRDPRDSYMLLVVGDAHKLFGHPPAPPRVRQYESPRALLQRTAAHGVARGQPIPRVDGSTLSLYRFYREYALPGLPVILTNMGAAWPATTNWSSLEGLAGRGVDMEEQMQVQVGDGGVATMALGEYFRLLGERDVAAGAGDTAASSTGEADAAGAEPAGTGAGAGTGAETGAGDGGGGGGGGGGAETGAGGDGGGGAAAVAVAIAAEDADAPSAEPQRKRPRLSADTDTSAASLPPGKLYLRNWRFHENNPHLLSDFQVRETVLNLSFPKIDSVSAL